MNSSYLAQLHHHQDHGFGLRMLLTLLLGCLIAAGLTFFMHTLIVSTHHELDETVRTSFLDFVRIKHQESSQRKQSKPQRPQQQAAPEAPSSPQLEQTAAQAQLAISAPQLNTQIDVELGTLGIQSGDGEYLPIVKVAPVYPFKAISQNQQGSCLVEYTVTETGATKDVHIVRGQCLQVFARASVDAAKKFKYKPRVIDGQPVSVPNVQNRFEFQLVEGRE